MRIADTVALITGSHRGTGREFVREPLARGAGTVCATARRPDSLDVDDSRIVRLRLDLLDDGTAAAAARAAPEVTWV